MSQITDDPEALKRLLKDALAETLREQHDLLREVFVEVLEDVALAEAIRRGRETGEASRDDVFRVLGGEA